ncbi:hypothetical protein ASD19_08520 [Microbacterium sp. Root53]|uniref:hypothetical protein n=1 Tax=Microbacterium sp. Root53 TaxID=1736553 RepID=UPI0006F40741|nr:hypothetical protein [Microbacterium sp. Root53]KQY96970.1 hypothetical protein ASD19_08520 [Microbacterium sp. Root53]
MLHAMAGGAAIALLLAPGASAGVDDDLYAPYQPPPRTEPSLNASAFAECVDDAPWITYDVTLIDPDGLSTSRDASLVFAKGGELFELPLGTLGPDDRLAGRVLWPAAAVGPDGAGSAWPGWLLEDGVWRDVGEANLGWTRSGAVITLEVNPAAVVAASYPPSTPGCVLGPRPEATPPAPAPAAAPGGGLAATGAEFATPLGVGAAMLVGGVLAWMRASRRPRR